MLTKRNKLEVKARLVVCQLAFGKRLDCWAGTPMTITHRLLLCIATMLDMEATVGDAKTAFLNAELPESERVAIVPPPGEEEPGVLYLVIRALYGLRKAPAYFQEWLAQALQIIGWRRCVLDPCLFVHDPTGSLLSHHADDILLISHSEFTTKLWADIESMLVIRHDFPSLDRDWRPYLGRLWRRVSDGWETKMKPGYFEELLSSFDLLTARAVSSPCWSDGACEKSEAAEVQELPQGEQTRFRMGVGKLSWSLPCRPEISFQVKELARKLQSPTGWDVDHLVRVLKFIQGSQDWVLHLRCTGEVRDPKIYVDSNWTCALDGRSTSGIVVEWCGFILSMVSKTQPTLAQSSCEAEILAANAGAVEGIYLCNLLEEIGIDTVPELNTDSSSCLATICRRGPGRMRHLRVKQLWLQEELRNGTIIAAKIGTLDNLADLFTKHLSGKEFRRQSLRLGLRSETTAQIEHSVNLISGPAHFFWKISMLVNQSNESESGSAEALESSDWEDDAVVSTASASSMSSRELAAWVAALAPCAQCQLRTPFRCGNCQMVVCLSPRCRDQHRAVCGMSWGKRMWICVSTAVWWLCSDE